MTDSPLDPRERLLQAALRLLAREGVQSLAQPQVAREAGLRQSHLTYYFPKKKDLLEAVLTRFLDAMARHLEEAVSRGQREGLRTLHDLITEPVHMRMLAGLAVAAETDAELRGILAGCVHRSDEALAQLLGRKAGDADVQHLVATLWGMGLRRMLTREAAAPREVDMLIHRFEDRTRPSPRRRP